MSKQVDLKFKKLLKNAEFVHADLEYHEQLLPEAKHEFFKTVNEIYQQLSPEDQKKIDNSRARKLQEALEEQNKQIEEKEETEPAETTETEEPKESPEEDEGPVKAKAVKLLYRRIASQTHPDKSEAAKLSSKYADRRVAQFKRAQKAYKDKNWFVLYQIAMEMGIPVPTPSKETLKWIEEDIKVTEDSIGDIASLVVWVFYSGGDFDKQTAIRSYFQQAFDFELGEINFSF